MKNNNEITNTCSGTTKAGEPCKNNGKYEGFCHQHKPLAHAAEMPEAILPEEDNNHDQEVTMDNDEEFLFKMGLRLIGCGDWPFECLVCGSSVKNDGKYLCPCKGGERSPDAPMSEAISPQEMITNNNQEVDMNTNNGGNYIRHYMHALGHDNPVKRIVTNMPNKATDSAIFSSSMSKKVHQVEGSSALVLANDTGDWDFPLLINRAVNMGVQFTIASYDTEVVANMEPETVYKMIENANFAWATSQNVVLIKFHGYSGWGLSPLGLKVKNHKKLSKRLTEVVRCSGHSFYGFIDAREFVTPEGEEDAAYDGKNAISESFAKKMGFTGTRGNIRVLTTLGLIKGDCIVVPDSAINADIVYHTENLKPELATTDWMMATVMDHSPLHDHRHDDQTRGNFSFFISEDTVTADLNLMVDNWIESIREGGELYNYIEENSSAYDDPIALDMDRIQMSGRIEENAEMLREVGIAPASFANYVYMRTGAITKKMEAHRIIKSNDASHPKESFKRMFIPASNAFVGSVSTYSSCAELCNMDDLEFDGTKSFWDDRVGIIMPDDRFVATYDLHGGWDLDDTVSVFAVRVFCSDDDKLDRLIDAGVIDSNLEVGRTEEEALFAGLFIRRPNGPGEYSIEALEGEMPWSFFDHDRIQTFDLAGAPEAQSDVFANTEMEGIPTSVTYDVPFSDEFALEMIKAQLVNPGVGSFANMIMVIAATFGPENMPSRMLGAMEDVIDSVQQTADIISFTAIRNETDRLYKAFIYKCIREKISVDSGIVNSGRIPAQIGQGDDAFYPVDMLREAGLIHEGPQRRINVAYEASIEALTEASKKLANQARRDTNTYKLVNAIAFGADLGKWADGWFRGCGSALAKLSYELNAEADQLFGVIQKRAHQENARLATEKFMDKWVATIIDNDRYDTHDQILALYKFIVRGNEQWPLGHTDRIFMQPSTAGKPSMISLFVEACEAKGILLELQLDAVTLN